jgi:hypothetical protein
MQTEAWRVAGTYFEACNCDAICPCRWQGGMKVTATGSTYGVCDFALSWRIVNGVHGATDLGGLSVVMAGSYRDDEPGKPWRVTLYVDDNATTDQAEMLSNIFLGRAGGGTLKNFGKRIGEVYAVRRAQIELDHRPRKWFIRAGTWVEVRASTIAPSDLPVSCGIPGHDRPGRELIADELRVTDAPFAFELRGRCGFETDFDYSSAEES